MLSTLAFESEDKASSQLNLCGIMAVEEQCNIYVTFESPKNVEITVWDNLKSGLKGVFAATHMGVIDRSFGLSLVHPEVSTTVTVYGSHVTLPSTHELMPAVSLFHHAVFSVGGSCRGRGPASTASTTAAKSMVAFLRAIHHVCGCLAGKQ